MYQTRNMAAAGGGESLSEECFDSCCSICKKKNRTRPADKYCLDCKKNLCQDCTRIHDDYNECHRIVDVHGADDEEGDTLYSEKCEKHTDELIKLFCVDHDALVCSVCALKDHRKCNQLKDITDSNEEFIKNQSIQEVPGQLKSALRNMDRVITALDRHLEKLSKTENTILQEIENYTKQLLARIEELKNNSKKKVTSTHRQLASKTTENRKSCTSMKWDITDCMHNVNRSRNRKANLFILMKKGQAMTRSVETLCSDAEMLMKRSQFLFNVNLDIEQFLVGFNHLGSLEERYAASSTGKFDVTVKGDSKPCDIEGCCLLSDGTLVLADDNNKRLKHLDPSNGSVLKHMEIQNDVLGVSCVDAKEVAVGNCTSRVKIVSVGKKMTSNSTVKLTEGCSRLSSRGKELFSTYGKCVYVHDLTGKLLRTIDKTKSGANLFSSIRGISLSQAGDKIYIADPTSGLICTDMEGQEVFRCSDTTLGLSKAHGVCTDHRGNVLVCGYISRNVVQVTEAGQVMGEILSADDGLKNPKCLCFDGALNILYIGGETPTVQAYRLE